MNSLPFFWWMVLVPVVLTAVIILVCYANTDRRPGYGYSEIGRAFGNLIIWLAGGVVALVVWLCYLLLVIWLG